MTKNIVPPLALSTGIIKVFGEADGAHTSVLTPNKSLHSGSLVFFVLKLINLGTLVSKVHESAYDLNLV